MSDAMNKLYLVTIVLLILSASAAAGGKLLKPIEIGTEQYDPDDRRIVMSGYNAVPSPRNLLKLERDNPWSLPKISGVDQAVDTLRLLGLRFDFIYETPDEDSTTGRGHFDFRDTLAFWDEYGHIIDPSPHDKKYFEAHFLALRNYYHFVSGGTVEIVWDVFPEEDTAVYHLPHPMRYYGEAPPYIGLTNYFIDCFLLVDAIDPNVDFSEYDSYFLFHAGADRQNDIYPDDYPPSGDTPFDLYTGYIFLLDSALGLDKVFDIGGNVIDSTEVRDALIMPEIASQDNRGVALNAVMAHEFGHQLGLPDLYRTDNFFTKVGDFALMDNNGHGTGIDFGFEVGRIFGVVPVYPMAWSRAFLGFDKPVLYRQGIDIALAAAEMQSAGIKIAKVPISEYEYYLLENRQIELDGRTTFIWADSATSVVMGPSDTFKVLTGEYDVLLPGSGMLIWKVDELVAVIDYDNDYRIDTTMDADTIVSIDTTFYNSNNYFENQLQNDPNRPFIQLMEADGLINFGPNYYAGYGNARDMYYKGNNNAFTPFTNPSSIAYGGTNTHIYIEDISESGLTMTFDLGHDFNSPGFPQRAGIPAFGLNPIAADIDGDDSTEIILASGRNLLVINEDGTDYTPTETNKYYDTTFAFSVAESYEVYEVPLFYRAARRITAGPLVGNFGTSSDSQYVAVGAGRWLHVFEPFDADLDGIAEHLFDSLDFQWEIVWLSFGNKLIAATMDTSAQTIRFWHVFENGSWGPMTPRIFREKELLGGVRFGDEVVFMAGDDASGVRLYYIDGAGQVDSFEVPIDGENSLFYKFGPVAADLDRNGQPEIIMASPDGHIMVVTVDTSLTDPFEVYASDVIGDSVFVNPVVGDLDNDGYADIILGGKNTIFALDKNLLNLNNFPLTIDRAFPYDIVIATPTIGDINYDRIKDIAVVTSNGDCYVFSSSYDINNELHYGFPIPAGGVAVGSPLLYHRHNRGGLGLMGVDGWFYSYEVGYDSALLDWPMGGGGPDGSYFLPEERLGPVRVSAEKLPEEKFFCYPNPTLDGHTTFRFYLGEDAQINMLLFDMSGKKVDERNISGFGNSVNDQDWDLSFLPSGVYRCVLKAEFIGGDEVTTFTDVAVIR